MRRRGKQFLFEEEAEAKFQAKQKAHMLNVCNLKFIFYIKLCYRSEYEKILDFFNFLAHSLTLIALS